MKRYKYLIIHLAALLCTVLIAPFATGQSGSDSYYLSSGGLVGGGGVSGSASYGATGTFGFGPMGVAASASYILNGGFAATTQQADVFFAMFAGEAVDTIPIAAKTLTVEVEEPMMIPEPGEEEDQEQEKGFWDKLLRVLRGLVGLGS